MLILALQAAQAEQPGSDLGSFDLRNVKPAEKGKCAASGSDEIVVCGSRRKSDRYQPLDSPFEEKSFKAETRLFGSVRARAHAESAELPGGRTSKRAMITLTTPF